jgi:hypothetical protein
MGAATALVLATATFFSAGVALADDAPDADATPVATPPVAPPPADEPTPPPPAKSYATAELPQHTAATGSVAGNSFSSPVSWNPLGLWPLVVLDNSTATVQSGEPTSVIGGGHIQKTVWIKWKAPRSGTVSLLAYGGANPGDPSPDTGMNVYTGSSLGTLKRIASNDDQYFPIGGHATESNPPLLSSGILGVDITKGKTYYIQVGSQIGSGGTSPAIPNLTVSVWGTDYRPANDDFIHAQEVKFTSAVHGEVSGVLSGATMEYWEPTSNDEVAAQVRTGSIWFKWTAPASGNILFGACAPFHSSPGIAINVFSNHDHNAGAGFGDLAQVQDGFDYGDDDSYCPPGTQSSGAYVLINIVKDVTYYVQVAETLGGIAHDVDLIFQTSYSSPYVVDLSKTSGSKNGGTIVTITGVNLGGGGLPTVWFGTKAATVTTYSANSITVKTPKQSHTGKVSVYVVNGGEDSNKVGFTYK